MIGVRPLEEFEGHHGRSTAGGVRMILWKLEQSRKFRKTSHKVESQKSLERVGLLRTSARVILYPTDTVKYLQSLCVDQDGIDPFELLELMYRYISI